MRQHTVGNRRERRVIGAQSWRDMLFLHWRAPIDELRRRVPPELAIDTFEGNAYVGIVAFRLARASALGVSLPLVAPALELNVRTYVRTPHGPPGIFFFSLDATRLAYAAGARALLRNATHWAHASSVTGEDRLAYVFERRSSRAPASLDVAARIVEAPRLAEPGTLEHFLIERYVMYAPMPRALVRVRVQHPAYALARAEVASVADGFATANGVATAGPIASALASPGVDCRIAAPERVDLRELLIHADDPADDMTDVGDGHARRPTHWIT